LAQERLFSDGFCFVLPAVSSEASDEMTAPILPVPGPFFQPHRLSRYRYNPGFFYIPWTKPAFVSDEKERDGADAVAGTEDRFMRKMISYMNEEERQTLRVLADLGVAAFSAALTVSVLRFFVNLIL
jgi:hypothetical protein